MKSVVHATYCLNSVSIDDINSYNTGESNVELKRTVEDDIGCPLNQDGKLADQVAVQLLKGAPENPSSLTEKS